MEIEELSMRINDIHNAEKLKIKEESKFLKVLITLSIGFVSLLVSLKREELNACDEKWSFFLTILSISIGILFGLIQLSFGIHVQKRVVGFHYQQLQKLTRNENIDLVYSAIEPLIYRISSKLCYTFLVLGLICVVLYSYLSIF
jgi:hypothetical protein